jgi:prolyl-tRNA editing enzyme YbaK/EbsC (Cys-tRNA(Pro) deacylase)
MILEHASVVRVEQELRALGVRGEVVQLPDAARTASAAAAQLGCEVCAIANSLIFKAAEAPVLVMTSGAHRVDLSQVAGLLNVAALDRADAEFVRTHTGMAIGGVAPVGFPQAIRTIVDVDLARYDQVWAAAGHPHTVFPTTYGELLRMTAGTAAVVA